jgi:hypothetical protein
VSFGNKGCAPSGCEGATSGGKWVAWLRNVQPTMPGPGSGDARTRDVRDGQLRVSADGYF